MASMTNYLENKLIDYVFRGVAYTPPAIWYIGLFTAAPSETGGGTEVTGNAYARQAITKNTTAWAATNGATTTTNPSSGTSGTTSNNSVLTFPSATPGNWGTISHVGLFDAITGGNLCFYNSLPTTRVVNAGDGAVQIPISGITVQLDN
jgi:hypothetical protein